MAEPETQPEAALPLSRPARPMLPALEEDTPRPDALRTLIPYGNPRALTAYYLGVFSIIPGLGLILGPMAVVLGMLGIRHASQHPAARGGHHAVAGVVLGAATGLVNLLIFAALLIGLLLSH
jgi:hypothetical protein